MGGCDGEEQPSIPAIIHVSIEPKTKPIKNAYNDLSDFNASKSSTKTTTLGLPS